MTKILRKTVFGAVMAASLGFGAAQAFAAPAAAEAGEAAACTQCIRECGSLGGVFKSGRCLCCG